MFFLEISLCREQLEKKEIAMEEAKKVAVIESKKKQENEAVDRGQSAVDMEALASLRERYCVQCLEKMGEYLEVLGPVLHERGVDVCLALLQRRPKDNNPKELAMLSDVLKLICALAAHRKFAALFVDRGGVQQLLATPRVSQTLTGISLCLFALASLQVSGFSVLCVNLMSGRKSYLVWLFTRVSGLFEPVIRIRMFNLICDALCIITSNGWEFKQLHLWYES